MEARSGLVLKHYWHRNGTEAHRGAHLRGEDRGGEEDGHKQHSSQRS
jgi:hypothetical protein